MRIGILSDIHANLEALQAALADMGSAGVERIVCLGDIVGYNTDPSACIALLREGGALCIAGNHDRAVTRQIPTDGFSVGAIRAVAWTRKRLSAEEIAWLTALPLKAAVEDQLVVVHGALHVDEGCELVRLNSDDRLRQSAQALLEHPSGARVCAFGHTHRLGVYEYRAGELWTHEGDEVGLRDGSVYLLNPGTVGEPRTAERRATYIVFDTVNRVVNVRRVPYDDATAFAKTRKAGIQPRRLLAIPAPIRSTLQEGLRRVGLYEMVRRVINS
ncbi:metallophosphoesterase family protein [Azospirillum rugosum]|uniref:Phosphodiesterase n=1 Tax=Azospirillum rugosum TaxID=416170 RepID=A0ABS4SGI3_9PROT|nr:metallophosphoesterase family protein [Azospirillum rugosum]MBP2291673.1 putative phosphodiesterase [Azospirillum rugosum]MDQ0524515.1 putative phosphodiesterase [Azospirillum rugosum]